MSIALLAVAFSFTACAQNNNVPKKAKKAFMKKFPKAQNANWGKENSNEWEAEFTMNDKNYSANFNSNGKWMETEMEIDNSQAPQMVMKNLKTKYPKAEIKKVYKIKSPKGTSYEVEIENDGQNMEVVFNSRGKMMHKEKTKEGDEEDEN